MAATNGHANGRVVRVIGPVVDVEFPPTELPEINTALHLDVELGGETTTITCEVAQHIGDAVVRAIALKPTDGVVRGSPVENTGAPGEVPLPDVIEGVKVDGAIGWTLTYPANFTGHPATSVPAGQVDGLPVGMQIMGRLGADGDVLAAAGAMERIRPWSDTYAVPAERSLA